LFFDDDDYYDDPAKYKRQNSKHFAISMDFIYYFLTALQTFYATASTKTLDFIKFCVEAVNSLPVQQRLFEDIQYKSYA